MDNKLSPISSPFIETTNDQKKEIEHFWNDPCLKNLSKAIEEFYLLTEPIKRIWNAGNLEYIYAPKDQEYLDKLYKERADYIRINFPSLQIDS